MQVGIVTLGQTCPFCLVCFVFFFAKLSQALQLKEGSGVHSPLIIQKHDQNLSTLKDIVFLSS